MPWPYRPAPATDELLSSYLVRCAGRYGMPASRFCAFHFPGFQVWTRDVDRSATRPLLDAVAVATGLSHAQVIRMTLRAEERRVSVRRARGAAAWINGIGVYHRVRRLHGLQYCPACLESAVEYKKVWRLSFVVSCETHGCALRDACPYCDAPIIPHQQMAGAARCHMCHRSLVVAPTPVLEPSRLAVALQALCLRALETGVVDVGGRGVPAQAYFRGLRILASAVVGSSGGQTGFIAGLPIEHRRTTDRGAVLISLASLLTDWPDSFHSLVAERHLTQRSFFRVSVPEWVNDEVRHLPRGRTHNKASRHSLRAKLAALGRRKPAGWRALRAAMLLVAARTR